MHPLSLTLLGTFQARYKQQPLPGFRTKATQALLIYLSVQPNQAHDRERLMTLLWPRMPQKSARANLRQTLYQLRQAVPDVAAKSGTSGRAVDLVIANRQDIQLNPAAEVDTDVLRFEALLARSAAHQQGVIHRDLKPANILLDEAGNSYLTDFGIAKELMAEAVIPAEGAVVGTLDYVSPEQIKS